MNLDNYFANVDEAAGWIKSRIKTMPRVAVILSGGLGKFIDDLAEKVEISSGDVPFFPPVRVEGHLGKLIFGNYKGVPVMALAGRYHYYEGHAPQTVVFPYFVFAKLGAEILITTNAVGGVNKDFIPGDIMLVEDHINMMGINPLIGLAIQKKKDQFTNMTNAYDSELRKLVEHVAKELGIKIKRGVYLATSGPSYETKAEITAYRKMGADAVGMSTVPEAIAANFLGMKMMAFSCIANMAADLHGGKMNHAEVLAAMNEMAPKMVTLLQGVVKIL